MKLAKLFLALEVSVMLAFSNHAARAQTGNTIFVREVRVTGEGDSIFGPNLELEVHMYWQFSQDSIRFLGCSGENQGLRSVDVSEILYVELSGFFQKPTGGNLILADIENKNIYLITSEDDDNPCPVQYGGVFPFSDDLIGRSEIFSGNQLANLKSMAFGRVEHLFIGAGDYNRPYPFTDQSHVLGNRFDASKGGCWGDFDNDGDPDLFIPNGKRFPSSTTNDKNQLFLNHGDGSFSEVTSGPVVQDDGNSTGCTCGDYDNDGDLDLYVTNLGPNFLYANDGNGTFTRITQGEVVTDDLPSTAAAWGDFDLAGDLDLFVANGQDQKNSLYLNNGNGHFAKADPSNIVVSEKSFSTGCNWVDYDADGDPDLFVTNANNQRNFLYRNLGNGAFAKITAGPLVTENFVSRGASWGDYDHDGDQDVFVADSSSQAGNLYTNNGNGTFSKLSRGDLTRNLSSSGSSWGDFDNDGDLDLVGAGNLLSINLGASPGIFWRILGQGVFSMSTSDPSVTWIDYDGDGQLDAFVARNGFTNKLYRNDGGNNNWLKVRCQGTLSNRSAIGAKVRAKALIDGNPVWQLVEISAQTGRGGHGHLEAHFGLGLAQAVDSLLIYWPAGGVDVLTGVAVNQVLTVTESDLTSVDEISGQAPTTFKLAQNYPNPFNPETTIECVLPAQPSDRVHVTLRIYNLQGQVVRTLIDEQKSPGHHRVVWDGKNEAGVNISSGVYLYTITAGDFKATKRMVMLK